MYPCIKTGCQCSALLRVYIFVYIYVYIRRLVSQQAEFSRQVSCVIMQVFGSPVIACLNTGSAAERLQKLSDAEVRPTYILPHIYDGFYFPPRFSCNMIPD